jgi:hypothetical protein
MRTLPAIALILAGAVAGAALLPGAADARKARHYYRHYQPYPGQPRHYYEPPRYYAPRATYGYGPSGGWSRQQALCEERARNEDPTGQFAGYPCWAREVFGRGAGGGRR